MAQDESHHFADRIIIHDRHEAAQRNLQDVADGVVLVGQIRQVLDDGSKIDLVINVELLSAEWVLQCRIENDGAVERTRQETTDLGMTVKEGTEVAASVTASAGFSGWSFSAQVGGSLESKTFSLIETSTMKRVTDTYTCPARSAIFVYKRRYKFRCRTWFFHQPTKHWLESNAGKLEAQFVNEITANQELISPVALRAHGKITNKPPPGLAIPTIGFNLEKGSIFDKVLIAVLRQMYPWVK